MKDGKMTAKEMKPMTKKSTDVAKKTPVKRLVKGSKEAADYMKALREKKKPTK